MHATRPLFYSRTNIYVRADDARFDGHADAINDPAVRIATVDGEMAELIAKERFPKAQIVSLPQTTDLSQMLLSVATGKADVALVNDVVASGYLKANPGQIKTVATDRPLRVFSHGLAVGATETELGNLLDAALNEMDEQGILDRLLTEHELLPDSYLRVAPPYVIPKE
jgi:ABC-type amino acid transport substrate-binding protein